MRAVPEGASPAPAAKNIAAVGDLIPADIDLVLRLDLQRARQSLGEEMSADLIARAADAHEDDAVLAPALARAEVAWLATRLDDLEAGDRILALRLARRPRSREPEAPSSSPRGAAPPLPFGLRIDDAAWRRLRSHHGVRRYQRRRLRRERAETERIYVLGPRTTFFVSPVEVPAVERVIADGPDETRIQPEARGIFSGVYRAGRWSPERVRAYPALAKLWRGLVRIEVVVSDRGDALELEGRLRCRTREEASRWLQFLTAIRDGSAQTAYGPLVAKLELSRASSTVALRWPWSRAVLERVRDELAGSDPDNKSED
ncbi:MAG: hypothetical protein AAF928_07190 [Myxococcota bacterium]